MIVYNAIGCKYCFDVIESIHVHDYKTCRCGRVSVDGGACYLRRGYIEPDDYYELSVDSEDEFVIVRQFAFRTGYGKPGASDYGVFRQTRLCDMTDGHLQAALNYVKNKDRHWRLLLEEKLYRAENEIFIDE